MEKMDIFKQNNNRGMAKRTFKDKMTLGKGADQIDLYNFGPAHTNGDAIVLGPPFVVTNAELVAIVDRLANAVETATAASVAAAG